MHNRFGRFGRGTAIVAFVLASAPLAIADDAPMWEVTRGTAIVVCPLTVGGSFEARSSALSGRVAGDPVAGELAGTISVDLRTLDTGIGFRNQHMKDRYLEVQKGDGFDHAQLTAIHVEGIGARVGAGKGRFQGSFRVHGESRTVDGDAEIRVEGSGYHVEAAFPLRMSDYGIAKTEYLGVGVKNEIRVRVVLEARPAEEGHLSSVTR